MKKWPMLIISALLGSTLYAAQGRGFDIASIKPNNSGAAFQGGCHGNNMSRTYKDYALPLGRCVVTSASLKTLIALAYRTGIGTVIRGGPAWISSGSDKYDIVAKTENPEGTTTEQLLTMLQSLLIDRFKLKFHRETTPTDGYALMVGRRGSKLRDARMDEEIKGTGFGGQSGRGPHTLVIQKFDMANFASSLSTIGLGPVIDKTELKGAYDAKLQFESLEEIPFAIQEQLGLRLEPMKVPIEVFVVDSAEKPPLN